MSDASTRPVTPNAGRITPGPEVSSSGESGRGSRRAATHAIGRSVEVRASADRIERRREGRPVGEHARSFGGNQTVYDPWHYVPVLAPRPGGPSQRRSLQALLAASRA